MSKTILALILTCLSASAQIAAVVNSASNRVEQPIAAGSWATIYGTFAGVTQTTAPGFPVPATLAGVQVLVNNIASPVYFVSSGQINFLVPIATQTGVQTLRVTTGGGSFDGFIRIMSAAPGIFVKEPGNAVPPKGAILNQNFVENSQQTPEIRGNIIQIYATGPGRFNQTVTDGAAAPSTPLTTTVSTPQVFIGGVPAQVQFSGLAPGFPGLWQVNAFIPNQPFIAGRVPVIVFIDGVDSNEVSIFVQ